MHRFVLFELSAYFSDPCLALIPVSSSDNAVMIAWASMSRFLSGDTDPYDTELLPKWDLESLRQADEPKLFDS